VNKTTSIAVGIAAFILAGEASAQGMLLDFAADKVINKYQTATCDELKAQKKQPPTDKEKEAVEFLRSDSQARIFYGFLLLVSRRLLLLGLQFIAGCRLIL